jgi:hypothetical protein
MASWLFCAGTSSRMDKAARCAVRASLVRRYLYTTPTGRIAVEMFKDATGKPNRAFLEAD